MGFFHYTREIKISIITINIALYTVDLALVGELPHIEVAVECRLGYTVMSYPYIIF